MVRAALLFVATEGALGKTIAQGFTEVNENTDFTVDVKSRNGHSAKKVFSDGALYLYHRASNDGCKGADDSGNPQGKSPTVYRQNNGLISSQDKGLPDTDGYPGLEGSFLTRYPECAGRSSTAVRGTIKNSAQDMGNDMEGIFSRLDFKIQSEEPIVLDTDNPDTWLEWHIFAAGQGYWKQRIANKCGSHLKNTWDPSSEAWFGGTGNVFVIFYPSSDSDDRLVSGQWIREKGLTERLYCTQQWGGDFIMLEDAPLSDKFDVGNHKLKLCPGAEGYIQMNKGVENVVDGGPNNELEAAEDLGTASNYPYIQIEKLGDCS
jgi:hypothetical protein